MSVEVEVAGHQSLQAGSCRVIAEAGVNHGNSVERAIELAERAAAAGAWAVKFQLYKADSISVPNSPKYWRDEFEAETQYEAFQRSDKLDYAAYREVAAACQELGIIFFATPFDLPALEALEAIDVPIYKLASGDLTHRPLLEAVARTGKPLLLSTGAATEDEVRQAVEWTGLGPERLVLLACTLTYPTPDQDAHFARLESFRTGLAPYLCGFSDHTLGPEGGWMTAALGGVCIEKHYTLDKSLRDVPDHAISLDPAELAELVSACERGAMMRGESWIGVRDSERPARLHARRSIVLERDVRAGSPLRRDDVGFKRPGTGVPPFELERVLGRTLRHDLFRGALLAEEDLDG